MNLKWKGKLKNIGEVSKGNLPEDSIKFKEPNTMFGMNFLTLLCFIPIYFLVLNCLSLKFGEGAQIGDMWNIWGIALAVVVIIPHEILHAIVFPNESEVEAWYSPKYLALFVFSVFPLSKKRFIFMCLLPNIVFGIIPFIIWLFIPNEMITLSKIIFSFSYIGVVAGTADYLNVVNAIFQVPKNAYIQMYGINTYWYMPDHTNNSIAGNIP